MNLDRFYQAIGHIHSLAQRRAGLAINQALNWRNWLIGAYIVEFEQGGEDRAACGSRVLESLANRLKQAGHEGLSLRNLKNFRRFALAFSSMEIRQTLSAVFINAFGQNSSALSQRLIRQTSFAKLERDNKSQTLSDRSILVQLRHLANGVQSC